MNIRNLLRTIDGIGVTVGPFLTRRSAERFARQATDSLVTSTPWEAYRR